MVFWKKFDEEGYMPFHHVYLATKKMDCYRHPLFLIRLSMLLNMQIVHTDTMVKWHGCRCSLPQWFEKMYEYIYLFYIMMTVF